MSDTILTATARRLRYDAKAGTAGFAFNKALANLLESCDQEEREFGPIAGAEEVAEEYLRLSDQIAAFNEGSIHV